MRTSVYGNLSGPFFDKNINKNGKRAKKGLMNKLGGALRAPQPWFCRFFVMPVFIFKILLKNGPDAVDGIIIATLCRKIARNFANPRAKARHSRRPKLAAVRSAAADFACRLCRFSCARIFEIACELGAEGYKNDSI